MVTLRGRWVRIQKCQTEQVQSSVEFVCCVSIQTKTAGKRASKDAILSQAQQRPGENTRYKLKNTDSTMTPFNVIQCFTLSVLHKTLNFI